jgi:hypothetical protein
MLSGCPVPDRPDQSDGSGATILLSEARKAEVAESYLVAETEVLAVIKHFLDPAANIEPRGSIRDSCTTVGAPVQFRGATPL